MRLKFNGIVEERRSGCGACGKRRVVGKQRISHKTYYLPTGITKTFRVGKTYDLSQKDADFLLSYTYTDNGNLKHVFEVV